MTAQYRVLPAADRDLDDQASYLAAQASLDQALRFYDAASATFAKLASMPGIGERWPSTNPRLAGLRVGRIEGFEKHLVFYRPVADGIEVIRIIHGARDIDNVLESGSVE
jgi:toxin ParE1/3/4